MRFIRIIICLFILVFGIVDISNATIAFNAAGVTGCTPCTGATLSFTVGSGSNRILIAHIQWSSPVSESVSSVTWNGTALTVLRTDATTNSSSALYYLIAPASGTFNLVVTMSALVNGLVLGATDWTGVAQASTWTGSTGACSSSTAPSVNISSTATDMVVDAMAWTNGGGGTTATVGAGQTQRYNQVRQFTSGAGSNEAGSGTVTMSWTLSASDTWCITAGSMKDASAVGGTNRTLTHVGQ